MATRSSPTRVIDPATAATVERIFDLIEAGSTYGEVARTLNEEGITGSRGRCLGWQERQLRSSENRAFIGERGYPPIIDTGALREDPRRSEASGSRPRRQASRWAPQPTSRSSCEALRSACGVAARCTRGLHPSSANLRLRQQTPGHRALCDATADPCRVHRGARFDAIWTASSARSRTGLLEQLEERHGRAQEA